MDRLESLFIEAMALNHDQRDDFLKMIDEQDADLGQALRAKLERARRANALFDNMFDRLPELFESNPAQENETPPPTASSLTARMDPFADYEIQEKIGSGGMGSVFLARHRTTGRRVALKVLTDTGSDLRDRFDLEYRLLALMEHHHIAGIYDAGTTVAGEPFFTMEFIDGPTITAFCHQHQLDIPSRIKLFLQCCEGVQHAHQKSVVHRDLKPANILVTGDVDRPVVKIIDFGIAKDLNTTIADWAVNTRDGLLVGTLNYMSPEQLRRDGGGVDTRGDIYALGVVLYELITSRLPLDVSRHKNSGLETIFRYLQETEPVSPSRLPREDRPVSGRISTDLDCIVQKALAKDVERRYPTVANLIDDLRNVLEDRPISARPPGMLYPAVKFVRRNKVLVTAGCMVLFALVAGFTAATQGYLHERRALHKLQATNDFLNQVLSFSDPRHVGVNAKVVDLLATAEANMDHSLADDEFEASIRLTLGSTYLGMGLYDKAETHFQRVVQLLEQAGSEDRPDLLARAHFMLSVTRGRQGDYPAAENHINMALTLQTKTLEPGHRDTLRSKSWQASLLVYRRRWIDARLRYQEVYNDQRRLFGATDPDTLQSLGGLANATYGMRNYVEALDFYRQVYQMQLQSRGEDHPETLATRNNLARCLSRLGRYEEAETHLRETIRLRAAGLGPNHDLTLKSRQALANLLRRSGRRDEAAALAEHVLAERLLSMGQDHPATLSAQQLLAAIYHDTQPELAADLLRGLLAEYDHQNMHGLTVAGIKNDLGDLMIQLGQYQAAVDVLEDALAGKLERLGPNHPGVRNTRENLTEARLCLTWSVIEAQ